MVNLFWQTEHQQSAQTVYTTDLLKEKYGEISGEYFPISELNKYINENNKPELVITDLGQDNRNNGNSNNCLAQITVGNIKTIGSGDSKKVAKQNAAQAMLICLKNNGKGAQILKYKETESGAKFGWPKKNQPKIDENIPAAVTSSLIKPWGMVQNKGNLNNNIKNAWGNTVKKQESTSKPDSNKPPPVINLTEQTDKTGRFSKNVIEIEDDPGALPITDNLEAKMRTASILQSKNPVAYCNEASTSLGQKLVWSWEEGIANGKPCFTCIAKFGKLEFKQFAMNKKEAKTKCATEMVTGILQTYGDHEEIKRREKANKRKGGGGWSNAKRMK